MVSGELCVLRVVEGRVRPTRGVVAGQARGREELRLRGVAWIGGVVVVGLMASDTCSGQSCVVAINVAIAASPRRHGVRAGQWECRVVVIEG